MKIYYINQDQTQEINFTFLCKKLNIHTLSLFPCSYIISSSPQVSFILSTSFILAVVATSMSVIDYKPKLQKMKEETAKYNTIKAYNEMLKEKYSSDNTCSNADTAMLNQSILNKGE